MTDSQQVTNFVDKMTKDKFLEIFRSFDQSALIQSDSNENSYLPIFA